MAWNRVQSVGSGYSSGTSGTSVTNTWTLGSTPTTGNKIIVVVGMSVANSSSESITSVKDGNANSLTQAWAKANTNNCWCYCYFYDVPATPSTAITIVFSKLTGVALDAAAVVQEISGLTAGNTTACLDGTASTHTGTATPSGTSGYASTATNEYLISGFGDFGGPNNVSLTGWSLDTNSVNNSSTCDAVVAYKNSTGGSESDSWTIGAGDEWSIGTVAFKVPAAGFVAPPATIRDQAVRRAAFF